MTLSLLALLGFAAWTLLLLLGIALLRCWYTLAHGRRANSFAVSGEDVSAFSGRLCRAHANCYECLPALAAIVLVAQVIGHSAVTNPLALWLLAARLGQSGVHLVSTRSRAVVLRFSLLMVQWLIQAYWVVQLLALAR